MVILIQSFICTMKATELCDFNDVGLPHRSVRHHSDPCASSVRPFRANLTMKRRMAQRFTRLHSPPPAGARCAPMTPSWFRSMCVACSSRPPTPAPPTRPSPLMSIPVAFSILLFTKSIKISGDWTMSILVVTYSWLRLWKVK